MENCSVLISSTVFPREARDESVVKSVYPPEERILQTRKTIESLRSLGYEDLYLFDNSGNQHRAVLIREFGDVHVQIFDHFQFDNKGISETYLMLEGIRHVPDDRPLIKLSGRYRISRRPEVDIGSYDLAARIYRHEARLFQERETMATRCYVVRNRAVYRSYLIGLLQEIYSYSARVVGFGSLRRFMTNQLCPKNNVYSYFDPALSVEAASIRVVRNLNLKLLRLDSIGLHGLAGTFEGLQIED